MPSLCAHHSDFLQEAVEGKEEGREALTTGGLPQITGEMISSPLSSLLGHFFDRGFHPWGQRMFSSGFSHLLRNGKGVLDQSLSFLKTDGIMVQIS